MAQYLEMVGGVKIPTVGLGTAGISTDEDVEKVLDAAFEAGYRHIDTAAVYRNEAAIGKVLEKWLKSGKLKREELFVTTKLPARGTFVDKVEHHIKESLANLRLDYVDLYLIHSPVARLVKEGESGFGEPVENTDHIGVWKKMEEQVDAGRAKTIGLSNFNVSQIQNIIDHAKIKPANLQVQLSPYLQRPEFVKYCQDNNIVVVGWSTLGGRSGTFKMGDREITKPNILEDEVLKKVAAKNGKSPAQVVLRFFLQKNVVVIPKSKTPERVKQNIEVFDFSLDEEDVAAIEKLDKGEAERSSFGRREKK